MPAAQSTAVAATAAARTAAAGNAPRRVENKASMNPPWEAIRAVVDRSHQGRSETPARSRQPDSADGGAGGRQLMRAESFGVVRAERRIEMPRGGRARVVFAGPAAFLLRATQREERTPERRGKRARFSCGTRQRDAATRVGNGSRRVVHLETK